MTQSTGGISSADYVIESSPDGSTWTDRSNVAVKLTPTGGNRKAGEVNTADGDTPIVTFGKRESMDIAIEYVYTEVSGELFGAMEAAHVAGTAWYWRWAPKGGQTGEFRYTTAAGKITQFEYPKMDQTNGDPVVLTAMQKSATVTKATVA